MNRELDIIEPVRRRRGAERDRSIRVELVVDRAAVIALADALGAIAADLWFDRRLELA